MGTLAQACPAARSFEAAPPGEGGRAWGWRELAGALLVAHRLIDGRWRRGTKGLKNGLPLGERHQEVVADSDEDVVGAP